MLTLAIDTATPTLVVGVGEPGPGGRVLAEAAEASGTRHAELLSPTVTAVLARAGVTLADVGALVVGLGPGPYTGLRVGIVTAAALGDARGLPVHGVCSLDAVGSGARVVVTDARRKEVHWRAYDADGAPLTGPSVGRPEVVELPDLPVVGDVRFAERLGRDVTPADVDTAGLLRTAAPLLAHPAAPLVPLYLRRPDAVPNVVRKPVTR
ncbi:tRNA (adenosine(37)-N6)-threonylcarbamoyltransferase complex dimerization subunit type 1 TsaB [Modestobacter sp. Leaf380]|uniref:tRNA (adenosine(37)-N6)-threonylcarbamoyltransferase complex dimerization subunit type 1 TsaB n=1 Tax=Modestobacter sp. Leaf380 TaxID=1736356 RepID=UPI0006F6FC1C|nr:tRNA (adenosine(37)-N6)-threonylcarbamoyltransferase complex dimerization subunit type 1 TsaB [Modestobacter sp. Leaf380]KQS73500.1 tRNA threonylcarbamoyladenosine biosynthesis protein TsaB [Modestobacter sp. Leaf380]